MNDKQGVARDLHLYQTDISRPNLDFGIWSWSDIYGIQFQKNVILNLTLFLKKMKAQLSHYFTKVRSQLIYYANITTLHRISRLIILILE